MRRITTLALAAALTVGGAPAVLAQPGPPDERPAPAAQAQGSPDTGAQQAEQHGEPQGSPETGQTQRSEEHGEPQGSPETGQTQRSEEHGEPQGTPETGADNSEDGRARAAEASGMDELPAREQAREDGRAFGQERAEDAQERGNRDVGDPDDETVTATVDETGTAKAEVPAAASRAREVLSGLAHVLGQAWDVLKDLFGLGD